MYDMTDDIRNAMLTGLVGEIPTGTTIEFRDGTTAAAEVATCTLTGTVTFTGPVAGVLTVGSIDQEDNATGGTVDHAVFRLPDSTGTEIFSATCASGSGEFDFNSLVIAAADAVEITSLTITMPAGT